MSSLKNNGLTYSDAQDKANILNSQFSSAFTTEDLTHMPTLPASSTPFMSPITVTVNAVIKLLNGLKPHKAGGPDKIPSCLMKLAANELAPGLTKIFQLSLDRGKIPSD